jgi:hypothetical protein
MQLDFDIQSHYKNAFGDFIVGTFIETPPLFASDQQWKLGKYTLELWGQPNQGIWTLKVLTDKDLNEVWEEQVVRLQIL